jgi:hypothetical protein
MRESSRPTFGVGARAEGEVAALAREDGSFDDDLNPRSGFGWMCRLVESACSKPPHSARPQAALAALIGGSC